MCLCHLHAVCICVPLVSRHPSESLQVIPLCAQDQSGPGEGPGHPGTRDPWCGGRDRLGQFLRHSAQHYSEHRRHHTGVRHRHQRGGTEIHTFKKSIHFLRYLLECFLRLCLYLAGLVWLEWTLNGFSLFSKWTLMLVAGI